MKTNKPIHPKHASCFAAFLISILLSLSSCGIVNKLFTKNKSNSSTHTVQVSDSTGLKKTGQLSLGQKDSIVLQKKSEQSNAGVELVFADTSHHNQIEVILDNQGNQTIKATGFIQSLKTTQAHAAQSQDSAHAKAQQTVLQITTDSSKSTTQTNTNTTSNLKTVVSKKKSWQVPWYGYALFLLLALLLILYWRYRKNIRAVYHKIFS
jgi:cobalamin biosynthesis Mg chelatase CobN